MRQRKTDLKLELKKYFMETFINYARHVTFFLVSILSYSFIFLLFFAFINFKVGLLLFLCLFLISFISLIILPFYKYRSRKGDLSKKQIFNLIVKRAIDLIISVSMSITVLPLLIIIGLLIKLDSPGPIIYKRYCLGLNRHPFYLYKFRTLYIDSEHDPKVTRVGMVLRKTSLNELPQIINILLGDMSLVGPRALLPEDIDYLEPNQYRRFSFPPGLTGLWQISTITQNSNFEDMINLDLYYVDNWSLLKDLILLLKTPLVVFSSKQSV